MLRVPVVHLFLFCIEVNFQRIFKCDTNYVSMCKYNNYKFWDLTFFEVINKYSLRKISANVLAAVSLLLLTFELDSDENVRATYKFVLRLT